MKRAFPNSRDVHVQKKGKSIPNRRDEHVQKNVKSRANCRHEKSKANSRHETSQDKVQDKDQDENKFKMSVGMDVINCADNTSDKNPTTMTMKGIRGRLNRILATGSDVMCGCSVKEGKSISINFENNARVVVNVKGDEGIGNHETSEPRTKDSSVTHNRTDPGDD